MSEDKPDMAQLLDHYGVTYKPGKNSQKILCPFHDEKVESCSVNLSENWFVCHACEAKGDTWNFMMLKEGLGFAAIKQYAKSISLDCGTNVPRTTDTRTDGLFGRSRAGSRDRKTGGFRPNLRSLSGS